MGLPNSQAHAATATGTATVTAQVNAAARLTLGSDTFTFATADPTTTASIPANENGTTITVGARTSANGAVSLTTQAVDDLKSGTNVISINNLGFTCTGDGFDHCTCSKTAPQTIGSWTGPGTHTASLNCFLANSFGYATGTYSTTVTFTLTAP
jgi:hypothetical protein